MIRIKKFNENIHNREPKVGDYVIVIADENETLIYEFLKKEIGQISEIGNIYIEKYPYRIKYNKSVPIEDKFTFRVDREEIDKFAETKEELEAMIDAEKYNL